MATYSDLLASAKKRIKEISLDDLKKRLDQKDKLVLVDVREKEEFRAGFIPGAISVPRGFLESQIESRVGDKNAEIIVYCAGGNRSALAAVTLAELGYTNVTSASLGFTRWKDLTYPVDFPPSLTDAQRDRYSRHILLPEVGEAGQVKLLKSKVLLLGAGGLGSPAALYLAAAGVGTLGIVDADTVDASNLQRQILHATSRVGMPKVESAAKTIADLNPDVKVIPHQERLTSENVERLFSGYDLVVDGTDNFPTRYLVNDASVFLGKPVVHGSIFRFDGQVTTFMPKKAAQKLGVNDGPCYRCLYPEPPPPHLAPSCQEAGVLGILCGIVGTIQATEAIKIILGKGDLLVGRLLAYDSLKMKFHELRLRKDVSCPVCATKPSITSYIDYEGFCALA
jgi:molybdopterin/thiamine biosynthesis adenylyltransferase/rhodanese-related sulfurtransferase